MATHTTATFEVTGWDEQLLDEGAGLPKFTRATVAKSFAGDITGTAALEYLMVYAEDGSATFVGLERVRGAIGERKGSFVLQHVGRFEDGAAKGELTVAPGSGTQDLVGVAGRGRLLADPSGSVDLSLTYD